MRNDIHRSTQRAIDMMSCVARHNADGLTLTELSVLLDAPKSSLFSILHTLHQNNLLTLNQNTGKYQLGTGIYMLAHAFLQTDPVTPAVRMQMKQITKSCRETCFFGVLKGGEVLYLLKEESPEPLRMVSQGNRLPAYCTGIGKALLCEKSPMELAELYPEGLKPITPHTITDLSLLIQQLEQVRSTGIAFECEESTPYVRCIGVPVRGKNGICAAMSVAVPIFRYDEEKEKSISALLRKAAETLSPLLWEIGDGFTDYFSNNK